MGNKLIPIEYKNQRIMTTKILAEEYGTKEENIKMNFSRNKERFIEGKHYYQLEGDELKEFKRVVTESTEPSIKYASVLTLWTDRGAARHAKILETDEAWEVYETLEDTYFKVQALKESVELFSAKEEIKELKDTLKDFKRVTEEAKQQYKPSHKKKLDYNRIIKNIVGNNEDTQAVKELVFAKLNYTKWEDASTEDNSKIVEAITTISKLMMLNKFEQLSLF